MNRTLRRCAVLLSCTAAACVPDAGSGPRAERADDPRTSPANSAAGPFTELPASPHDAPPKRTGGSSAPPTGSRDPSNTFGHQSVEQDPFDVLARMLEEGSPEVSSRMHGCQKMSYETIGSILDGLGVDFGSSAVPTSAAGLWNNGVQALGAPNYAARVSESLALTTSGATKLFDIFVQAAPEIIARMPELARCKLNGQPTMMFDVDGRCTFNGLSCLQGFLATNEEKALCDSTIDQASSRNIGQIIAVASILAAAHTCE
jgi:hypothetical protein